MRGTPTKTNKVVVEEIEYKVDDDGTIEVAVSPNRTIRVSPEAWRAQQEYHRRFKDYPNEMEKTDYTYSSSSKYHSQQIIPGFVIKPNMSRPSITTARNITSTANFTISSVSPAEYWSPISRNNYTNNAYDYSNGFRRRVFSSDESEVDNGSYKTGNSLLVEKETSFFSQMFLATCSFMATLLLFLPRWISTKVTNIYERYTRYKTYQSYQGKYYSHPGASTWSYNRASEWSSQFFQKITTTISHLTTSTVTYIQNNAKTENPKGRRKWFLLLLIPLLLLAGYNFQFSISVLEAILNKFFNFVTSIPFYISYFIITIVPSFILTTIPNFVRITLPYLFTTLLPGFLLTTLPNCAKTTTEYIINMPSAILDYDWAMLLTRLVEFPSYYVILFFTYFCTSFYSVLVGFAGFIFNAFASLATAVADLYSSVLELCIYLLSFIALPFVFLYSLIPSF